MVALTAAQTFVQADATRKASNQQADYARSQNAQNDAASQLQQVQIAEQSSQQMTERARQALIERGRLNAIAADLGGGNNVQRLGFGIEQGFGQDLATLEANRQSAIQQSQRSKEAGNRSTANGIAALPENNPLGMALQIAGAGLRTPAAGSAFPATSRMPTGPNTYPTH
jgi:hypothetical protein